MKIAYIYSVHTKGSDFTWKWRSADGAKDSKQAFPYYYDCADDARKHGYTAEYDRVVGPDAPPARGEQASGTQ